MQFNKMSELIFACLHSLNWDLPLNICSRQNKQTKFLEKKIGSIRVKSVNLGQTGQYLQLPQLMTRNLL